MFIWNLLLEFSKSRLENAQDPSYTWDFRQQFSCSVSQYQHLYVLALAYTLCKAKLKEIKKKSHPHQIELNKVFTRWWKQLEKKYMLKEKRYTFLLCQDLLCLSSFSWFLFKALLLQNFLTISPWHQIGGGGNCWRWLRSILFENKFSFLEKAVMFKLLSVCWGKPAGCVLQKIIKILSTLCFVFGLEGTLHQWWFFQFYIPPHDLFVLLFSSVFRSFWNEEELYFPGHF